MKRVMQSMAQTVLLALAVMAIVHPASAQQGKEYFVD